MLNQIFTIPNLITIFTILLGTLALTGITERYFSIEKILIALVTLVAAQLLINRITILKSVHKKFGSSTSDSLIEILRRTDTKFERFSVFIERATEVMVVGIDLGFMTEADGWFVKRALENGVHFKLLISDPATTGELREILNNHDERNSRGGLPVHDHVAGAANSLKILSSLGGSRGSGKLEIRARVDIPNPTMTLVDPSKPSGKIRVELKPYKKNHGDVPYFLLTRDNSLYKLFYDHYYVKLWNDSKILYQPD